MHLKCQCCGFEEDFADDDGQAAFDAGWDAPPMFTTHVSCPLCPAVCIVLGKGHKIAHALWEREGRPKEFSFMKCAHDEIIGSREEEKKVEDFAKFMEEIKG